MTANYQEYQRRKAAWIAANPNATPAEYTAAIRVIAKACGI